jgi:hypothetical protein
MAAPALTVDDVAQHLLSRKLYLTALELHQELLENNSGVHNVAVLNKFFNDPKNFSALVRRVEEEETKAKGTCELGVGSDRRARARRLN